MSEFDLDTSPLVPQERLPEGNKDHVPSERPQHHPAAVRVRVVRPAVHGDRIHGERGPQHVSVAAGDREHADAGQQHPLSQVNTPHTLFTRANVHHHRTSYYQKISNPPLHVVFNSNIGGRHAFLPRATRYRLG